MKESQTRGLRQRGAWRSGNPALSKKFAVNPTAAVEECRTAVKRTGGNVTAAARALDVSTRTLYRWIAEHPEILDGAR